MSRYAACLVGLLICSSAATAGPVSPFSLANQLCITQAVSGPLRVNELATQVTESTRAKMLAALARGDIQAVVVAWQAHTGRQNIPQWLSNFQAAFQAANQRMGPCKDVARSIFEGFKQLGKEPAYLHFRTSGAHKTANLIGFELRAGEPKSMVQVSNNSTHYAVQVGNRVYDAFTGPAGLEMAEYLKRLQTPGALAYETVSKLP